MRRTSKISALSSIERRLAETQAERMEINGTTALVTGSNRGLGRALVEALLDRGAARIYACTQRPGDLPRLDGSADGTATARRPQGLRASVPGPGRRPVNHRPRHHWPAARRAGQRWAGHGQPRAGDQKSAAGS